MAGRGELRETRRVEDQGDLAVAADGHAGEAGHARELGAQGWTIQEVRSAAREGVREGAWESDRTIEMKVICDEPVADAIATRVLTDYAPNYSVAVWFSDVQVIRPERF